MYYTNPASGLITKNNLNTILGKIFTYFFLIAGIILLTFSIYGWINWTVNSGNYNHVFAYNNRDVFTYNTENDVVAVSKIYNANKIELKLNLDYGKTIELYCEKESPTKCIYLDPNNSAETSKLNPMMSVIIGVFMLSCFFCLKMIQGNTKYMTVFLISFGLFLAGMGAMVASLQIMPLINYNKLSPQNNITNALVYSDISFKAQSKFLYRPVAKYQVAGKEYLFVCDDYISGTFLENKGKYIQLLYDKNDPSIAIINRNPFDLAQLIMGIVFISLGIFFIVIQFVNNKKTNYAQKSKT